MDRIYEKGLFYNKGSLDQRWFPSVRYQNLFEIADRVLVFLSGVLTVLIDIVGLNRLGAPGMLLTFNCKGYAHGIRS